MRMNHVTRTDKDWAADNSLHGLTAFPHILVYPKAFIIETIWMYISGLELVHNLTVCSNIHNAETASDSN